MLDYKRKQDDDRTKRMLDERNREKAEEKAARDRVKQQIALVTIWCWTVEQKTGLERGGWSGIGEKLYLS